LCGDISKIDAQNIIDLWVRAGLKNIRFSGGEPTLWNGLASLIEYVKSLGVKRIALSTNGSAPLRIYRRLISAGVDDISVSLDACCATVGEKMCGGIRGAWDRVVETMRSISQLTYLTVGVVVNDQNLAGVAETIKLADSLGVADIRIIPSAQYGPTIPGICSLDQAIVERHPILKYRLDNLLTGRPFRGLSANDSKSCYLVRDDMAACGGYHFPCIIYLREGGDPIGKIGPQMREEREAWYANHDTHRDPICKNNCLDVCVDYNNRAREYVLGIG
jgi:molybdenum cofactor biosynthesis enzyme MoaA